MSQRSAGLCTRCTRANAFPANQCCQWSLIQAEEENTYDSPIDGLTQNRLVEKVSLEVYVNPNPITFTSLPAKFQRHMVDPQRITPEDLNLAARRRCLLICQNLGGTKCGQEELCLSMFCGIVDRPSRIMDVLSISMCSGTSFCDIWCINYHCGSVMRKCFS